VRRQILLACICEQVARDALTRVRRGGAEAADTRVEELVLRIAVVDGDDQPAPDEARDVLVERLPLQRDVGELAVPEGDPARGEVVLVLRRRLALDPLQLSIALGDPQFVQMLAALHETRERQRVVELVGDDEVCAVARELVDGGEKCRAGFSPPLGCGGEECRAGFSPPLGCGRAEARPT
jgi:hypothetical protein